MTGAPYFIALDWRDEPTLWRRRDGEPKACIDRAAFGSDQLWSAFLVGLCVAHLIDLDEADPTT